MTFSLKEVLSQMLNANKVMNTVFDVVLLRLYEYNEILHSLKLKLLLFPLKTKQLNTTKFF